MEFQWIQTPKHQPKASSLDRTLTAPELNGLKEVYAEETEGKRTKGGGGKNDNAGKAKKIKSDWRKGKDPW